MFYLKIVYGYDPIFQSIEHSICTHAERGVQNNVRKILNDS